MRRIACFAAFSFAALIASVAEAWQAETARVYRPDEMRQADYSYAHGQDGQVLPFTDAGNVVETSRGRIMAVVLTTWERQGEPIDGIGVYDITNGRNIYGYSVTFDDTEMKTAGRSGERPFRCQLQRTPEQGLIVAVWADPDYLERTSRDAFSVSVEDLFRWRAQKAEFGSDQITVGTHTYHVISAISPGSSAGWALFDPDDLMESPERRTRPRYFVTIVRRVEGNFITTRGPEPIGDTGYVVVRDREGDLVVREGANAPLRRAEVPPTLPVAQLPKLPTIPPLPAMPKLPALPDKPKAEDAVSTPDSSAPRR